MLFFLSFLLSKWGVYAQHVVLLHKDIMVSVLYHHPCP